VAKESNTQSAIFSSIYSSGGENDEGLLALIFDDMVSEYHNDQNRFLFLVKVFLDEVLRSKNNQYFDLTAAIKNFPRWCKTNIIQMTPLEIEMPWLVFSAIDFLKTKLHKDMTVFEYGVGGSTIFLLKMVGKVITVEHNEAFLGQVEHIVRENKYAHWERHLIQPEYIRNGSGRDPADPDMYYSSDSQFRDYSFIKYASSIDSYPDEYFDVILIDGRARPSCLKHAISKVKEGGYIILDNSDRHQYHYASNSLFQRGWDKFFFFGPGPCVMYFWQTSIWQKTTRHKEGQGH